MLRAAGEPLAGRAEHPLDKEALMEDPEQPAPAGEIAPLNLRCGRCTREFSKVFQPAPIDDFIAQMNETVCPRCDAGWNDISIIMRV